VPRVWADISTFNVYSTHPSIALDAGSSNQQLLREAKAKIAKTDEPQRRCAQ
jgi:hypothetical protein